MNVFRYKFGEGGIQSISKGKLKVIVWNSWNDLLNISKMSVIFVRQNGDRMTLLLYVTINFTFWLFNRGGNWKT